MKFYRIDDLPPYVFATVDQLKRDLRRDGRDVVDLGFGNPDIPSPEIAVEKLREAALKPANHRYSVSRGIVQLRHAVAEHYERSFGVTLDPETQVVSTIGAKEGLAHLLWVLAARRRHGRRADAGLPDSPGRAAARGRHRRRRRRPTGGVDAIADAVRASQPESVIVSFPHNPTTAVATAADMQRLVDLAREHDFVLVHDFAYADIAFDGHRPPSVLAADGAARVRGRALQPDEVVLDGRLARRLRRRLRRGRRRAREAQVVPRLRDVPADPDRGDRHAAPGDRLPRRGLRDLPQPPRRALRRARARGLAGRAAARDDVRLGADPRAAARARLPRGRRCGSRARPASRSAPASASATGGDGHVRFALVENEQRIGQATRAIKKLLDR